MAAVGSAVRAEETWDGAWGGEVGTGQMRPGRAIAVWAGSVGGIGFSGRSGGRFWAELTVGTRWPTGTLVGLGIGPAVDLHPFRPRRHGGQVTVWAFAGVVPYARVGVLDGGDTFLDLGLRIAFPAIRW